MDTTAEFQNVIKKIQTGSPIDYRDLAITMANDPETILKYLSDNDYVQVYRLLHFSDAPMVIGKNADFKPDQKRVEGELKLLLAKKDLKALNQILSNFIININTDNYTSNQKVLKSMEAIGLIVFSNGAYRFNEQFA